MSLRDFVNVEALANEVLAKTCSPRLPNNVGIDIEAILANYCKFDIAQILELTLGGKRLSGALTPTRNLVMIEATDPPNRRRFSLAHELGHAEIEFKSFVGEGLFPMPSPTFYACSPADVADAESDVVVTSRAEMLANKFAACILMPAGLMREIWNQKPDVDRCAKLLCVSREALRYRLQALRLAILG